MFKATSPITGCVLLEFNKQKDLAMSFCRVQEYYESDLSKLNGKFFSFYEFIDALTKDDGTINYFSYWNGFNIPGNVYEKWKKGVGELTTHEKKLDNAIYSSIDSDKPYYVIGGIANDRLTINHELAHAMFSLKTEAKNLNKTSVVYLKEACSLNEEFSEKYKKEYDSFIKSLKKQGYGENVIQDEIQAYMSTSNKKELVEVFKIDYNKILPLITKYRKNFKKYYKQK